MEHRIIICSDAVMLNEAKTSRPRPRLRPKIIIMKMYQIMINNI